MPGEPPAGRSWGTRWLGTGVGETWAHSRDHLRGLGDSIVGIIRSPEGEEKENKQKKCFSKK